MLTCDIVLTMTDQPPAKATVVRLDPDLRARVDDYAKTTMRSMNGSVNYLVNWALNEMDRQAAERTAKPE